MEIEHRQARLVASAEDAAIDQLAFQRREETLAQGVVVAVPGRPIDSTTPASRQRLPNAIDVYWEPRSE